MSREGESKRHNLHCRFCRYYQLVGTRGGYCELMNVTVDGNREACPFAVAHFPAPRASIH